MLILFFLVIFQLKKVVLVQPVYSQNRPDDSVWLVVFKVGGTAPRGTIWTFGEALASKQSDGGVEIVKRGVGAITVKCDVGIGRKAWKTGRFN